MTMWLGAAHDCGPCGRQAWAPVLVDEGLQLDLSPPALQMSRYLLQLLSSAHMGRSMPVLVVMSCVTCRRCATVL
mgnify:CR=1 FL=1